MWRMKINKVSEFKEEEREERREKNLAAKYVVCIIKRTTSLACTITHNPKMFSFL